MTLEPIGDIASPALTETIETTTLTWETESDWDSASEERYVWHPSAVVQAGIGPEGWEDYSDGATSPGPWTTEDLSVTTTNAWDGSHSFGGYSENTEKTYATVTVADPQQYTEEIGWVYRETSTNTVVRLEVITSSGDPLFDMGANNPDARYNDANGGHLIVHPSPDYNEHRRFTLRNWDWANRTCELLWEDLTGSTSDQTVTVDFKNATTDDIGEIRIFHEASGSYGGGGQVEFWVDNVMGIVTDSYLQTATKSLPSAGTPDLVDLDYTLNTNSDIVLDVIGSPGTGEEEIQSQTLDGASSYSLSWASSHSDFQVRINFNNTDNATTSTLNRVAIEG